MSKAGASLATCYGPVSADVIAKAENIRLLILDVDGVLSDGLMIPKRKTEPPVMASSCQPKTFISSGSWSDHA